MVNGIWRVGYEYRAMARQDSIRRLSARFARTSAAAMEQKWGISDIPPQIPMNITIVILKYYECISSNMAPRSFSRSGFSSFSPHGFID